MTIPDRFLTIKEYYYTKGMIIVMHLYEITFSPTGGTQKCADLIAGGWEQEPIRLNLLKPISDFTFEPDDICLVAMPVFVGRIPAVAAQRLAKLHGNGAKAVLIAVYGNRLVEDALVEMEDLLKAQGFRVVAGVEAVAEHSVVRQYAAGRPDAADALVLAKFASKIRAKLDSGNLECPKLPGNRPYREAGPGLKPFADDRCIECGVCAAECPVGAISVTNLRTEDMDKCISCLRCVAVCPEHARHNDPQRLEALAQRLAPVCTLRRDNQLYL